MILFAFKHMQFGGGAEKNLIEVAVHVAQQQRVGFYFAGGHVDERLLRLGPVFWMPFAGRSWAAPLQVLHLAWLVLRHRVRIVHAHHRYPAFLASPLRRLLGFKLLTTVHNRFPDLAKASLWGDRALAVSEDVAQWLVQECGLSPGLVRVLHNGIAEPPQHSAAERAALRQAQGVPADHVLLCAVGRLTKQKNFALMLQALAPLAALPWTLLVVGEGEDAQALQQHSAQLGLAERVRWLGRRSDVPLVMQASDGMVMSSLWEGFPYVLIEALANRLTVVATDVGGVREAVLHEQTGLLVPSADAPALSAALRRLLVEPALRERLGGAGRALYEQRFSDRAMFAALDEELLALQAGAAR